MPHDDNSLQARIGAAMLDFFAMEDDRKLVAQGIMTQAEYDQEWCSSPLDSNAVSLAEYHAKRERDALDRERANLESLVRAGDLEALKAILGDDVLDWGH